MSARARRDRRHPGRASIFVGIGANLPHDLYGAPYETCLAALQALDRIPEITVETVSAWYESAPQPSANQPWYVNGVAGLATGLVPADLMAVLHAIEGRFGRLRSLPNAARVLDLDLLDYRGEVADGTAGGPILPHPRMILRAFVLWPLRDVAPDWRHPVSGTAINDLIAALPPGQDIRPLDGRG